MHKQRASQKVIGYFFMVVYLRVQKVQKYCFIPHIFKDMFNPLKIEKKKMLNLNVKPLFVFKVVLKMIQNVHCKENAVVCSVYDLEFIVIISVIMLLGSIC